MNVLLNSTITDIGTHYYSIDKMIERSIKTNKGLPKDFDIDELCKLY